MTEGEARNEHLAYNAPGAFEARAELLEHMDREAALRQGVDLNAGDAEEAEKDRNALKVEAREVMREELTERIRDFEYLAAVAEEAKMPFSVLYPPDRPFRQFVELVLERDRSDWDSVRVRLEKELEEL